MSFKRFCESTFSDTKKKIWYTGRSVDSDVFSYDYVGGDSAHDQEGPGFYFSNSLEDSMRYAGKTGVVLECKIKYAKSRLLVKDRTRVSENVVRILIKHSPDKEMFLSNFGENPEIAKYQALQAYVDLEHATEAYQTLAWDAYDNSPVFLKIMSRFYDGQISDRGNGIMHLVIYKPEIIQVVNKLYYPHDMEGQ